MNHLRSDFPFKALAYRVWTGLPTFLEIKIVKAWVSEIFSFRLTGISIGTYIRYINYTSLHPHVNTYSFFPQSVADISAVSLEQLLFKMFKVLFGDIFLALFLHLAVGLQNAENGAATRTGLR